MTRYLAISAVVVLAVAVTISAWVNRDLIRLNIASVYARVSSKAGSSTALDAKSVLDFHGDAPWALSALPECLRQQSDSHGTAKYVSSHVPRNSRPLFMTTLKYGDCTIDIHGSQAYVRRGADMFHIPSGADFFTSGNRLVLMRLAGSDSDLRIYQPVTQ